MALKLKLTITELQVIKYYVNCKLNNMNKMHKEIIIS